MNIVFTNKEKKMKLFSSITEWQIFRRENKFANKTLGFVPTMGNLHAGHASLLRRSKLENDFSVLSIFINPTQFNNENDLKSYPRTLKHDLQLAEKENVDFIFIPNYETMYPDNFRYKVIETEFSKQLCGRSRPGHFEGVLTVVLKLLNLIKPTRAYFGEKDYQQLQLIKGMVDAFFLDIEIVACKTIRNKHDLALSSRNNLLTPEQQELAQHFPRLLSANIKLEQIQQQLETFGFRVDYITEINNRRFGAVYLGDVRLIDNREKSC